MRQSISHFDGRVNIWIGKRPILIQDGRKLRKDRGQLWRRDGLFYESICLSCDPAYLAWRKYSWIINYILMILDIYCLDYQWLITLDWYKLIMSVAYNKKYKGQILRENQEKKKIQSQEYQKYETPKKIYVNPRIFSENSPQSKIDIGSKSKARPLQQNEGGAMKLNSKIDQEDQDDYSEQNKSKYGKKAVGDPKSIKQIKNKPLSKSKNPFKKVKKEHSSSSQDENKSDLTTESNNRNIGQVNAAQRNHNEQIMAKSNSRQINKLQTSQRKQKQNVKNTNKKESANKYLFYNKKNIEQQSDEQQENQFIKGKSKQTLSSYNYKKNVHIKGEDRIQRVKNKLGFIIDLANQDQIASVSYYSENGSEKQEPIVQNIQKQPPKVKIITKNEIEKQTSKPPVTKKNVKVKQEYKQIFPEIKQKQQIKLHKSTKQKKNQPIKQTEQPHQQKKKIGKQKGEQTKKDSPPNKFQIKLQEINVQNPVRIYQTPKRVQERNISSIQTIKKEPLSYKSKYMQIPQKNMKNSKMPQENENDQLLSIIKKNDEYLDSFKIQKYPKNYFESPRKKDKFKVQQYLGQQRRRIKTQLDNRNDDFSPLSEEQKATLAKLKAREELVLKRIKYQFYRNPQTLYENDYANESLISEDPIKNNQMTPTSNTYEISRVLPLVTETFRPKKSQVLQHYPLSLKSYQKPKFFNNENYRQNSESETQAQANMQYQYNASRLKKQSQFKNIYLHRNPKDNNYQIRNPKQKYQKIKKLLERV